MTSCDRIETRLDAWLDGELSAPETRELVAHLETCIRCRQAHQELQQTKAALGQFFRALQQEAPTPPARRLPGWLVPTLAAAAMVVLVVLFRGGRDAPLVELRAHLSQTASQVLHQGTVQVAVSPTGVLHVELGGERVYWEQRPAADAPLRYAGGFDQRTVWTYDAKRNLVSVVESETLDLAEVPPWPPAVRECQRLLQQLEADSFAIAHVEAEDEGDAIQFTLAARADQGESARRGAVVLGPDALISFSGSSLIGAAAWEAHVLFLDPNAARSFAWQERFPDAPSNTLTPEQAEALRALGYIDGG